MLRRPLVLLALPLFLVTGCGEQEVLPTCFEQLCTPHSSTCLGGDLAACGQNGEAWTISPCPQGRCSEATQGCVTYDCIPGARVCSGGSDNQVEVCPESGSGWGSPAECGPGEICLAGTCLATACEDGATRCGYRQIVHCDGGAWVTDADPCGGTEVCREGTDAPVCEELECIPGTASCEGGSVVACSTDGRLLAASACAAYEVCQDGHCRKKVCGVDDQSPVDAAADAGPALDIEEPDWGPETSPPPLEQLSNISFDLNGIPQNFNLNARADYISSTNTLKVSAGFQSKKIELNVGPIDPTVVGAFSDTDTTEIVVTICYFDGATDAQAPSCTVGFSHSSSDYALELEEHQNPGRVKGTFSTNVETAAADVSEITNGTFDVEHK